MDPRLEDVRRIVRAMARASNALDLRLARICCHIRQHDLRPLGYASFSSFIRERVDWQCSWQRQLARLLRSDLDLVKTYAAMGAIPLSRAVQAPGKVPVDGQESWVRELITQMCSTEDKDQAEVEVLVGQDATTVRRARGRARLFLGWRAPDSVADEHILDWYRGGILPAELLEIARQPPPAPDLSPASWPELPSDPATPLVGPWEEPRDLDHALELVDKLSAARRNRQATLGRLLELIKSCWWALDWEFDRFDTWIEVELTLSVRTAQRYRKLGRTLDRHPSVARAVRQGLSLERARIIGDLADTAEQAKGWLTMASLIPMTQLQEAPRDGRGPDELLQRYRELQQEAPDLVQQAMAQRRARNDGVAPDATETGAGLAGWTAGGIELGPQTSPGAPGALDPAAIKLAVEPAPSRTAAPKRLYAPPGLLEAARWLLEEVSPPGQQGCGRKKETRDYTCQNPECNHRSLRVHAHHVVPKALGGTDEEHNLRCLCPSCHLRLVHGGYMAIEPVGDVDVYLYPGRAVVVR